MQDKEINSFLLWRQFQSLNSSYPFFLRKRGIFQSCLGLWLQEKRNQYVGALPQMPFPLSVRQKRLWCLWWFDAQEYLSSVPGSPLSHPFSFWPGSQRVLPTPLPLIPLPSITKYYQVLPTITSNTITNMDTWPALLYSIVSAEGMYFRWLLSKLRVLGGYCSCLHVILCLFQHHSTAAPH